MGLTHFPHGVSSFGVPVIPDMQLGKVWNTTAYFVDGTNGGDGNDGSKDSPLATIQAGINKLSAGDKLYVKDGAYAETLSCATSRVQIIGESISGTVVTGATDATDTLSITGNEVTIANMGFRPYDTGSDISLIKTTGDGTWIQQCDFSGGEYQIENSSGDYCYVIGCHFITPSDVTDGACIVFEDANQCKVLYSSFFVDANTDAIVHHDADNLEVAWCCAVGDDDTGASAGYFIYIVGADATSQLMQHHNAVTLFAGVIGESAALVAAHGYGTGDLATTATVDSMEVDNTYFGTDGLGCTVFFDTQES
jgi:hypothetical protein